MYIHFKDNTQVSSMTLSFFISLGIKYNISKWNCTTFKNNFHAKLAHIHGLLWEDLHMSSGIYYAALFFVGKHFWWQKRYDICGWIHCECIFKITLDPRMHITDIFHPLHYFEWRCTKSRTNGHRHVCCLFEFISDAKSDMTYVAESIVYI